MDRVRLKLQLLGELTVTDVNGDSIKLTAKKSRALLAYLAMAPGCASGRDQLADLLWSENELQFAKTNLRQCLSALRKLLGHNTLPVILSDGDNLRLDRDHLVIDVCSFETMAASNDLAELQKARDLYQGPLLDKLPVIGDQFDQWVRNERNRLQLMYVKVLECLLLDAQSMSQNTASQHLAVTLLEADPANEKAHYVLMQHYVSLGDRSRAIRQYRTCSDELSHSLDVEPAEELRALYESLGKSDFGTTRNTSSPEFSGNTDGYSKAGAGLENNTLATVIDRLRQPYLTVSILCIALIAATVFLINPSSNDQAAAHSKGASKEASELQLAAPSARSLQIGSTTPNISIAVIPLRNLSDDSSQIYLSDGLSDDLVTELSRISGLSVLASYSSFQFRDADQNMDKMRMVLDVDYILSGSVRRLSDQLRVTVHLIRVQDSTYVWSEKFDRSMSEVLRVQDEITRQVVATLSVELTETEWQRLSSHRYVSPDAYDMLLRGLHPFSQFTEDGISDAREYFKRAIGLDSDYARAYANMALSYGREVVFRFTEFDPDLIKLGLDYTATAEKLDATLPQTQFSRAVLHLAERKHDKAVQAAQRAITLDTNYADGYAVLAQTLTYSGELDRALIAVHQAQVLNPLVPFTYHWIEGHILYQLGRYKEARTALELVYQSNPSFMLGLTTLAATLGQLNLREDADWISNEILTLKPEFSVESEVSQTPYRLALYRERLKQGLMKTELPL